MDGLHVIITENLKPGTKPNMLKGNGTVTMQKAGTFRVSIKEYDDAAKIINDKLAELYKQRDLVKTDPKKLDEATKAITKLNAQTTELNARFTGVRWIYQGIANSGLNLTKDDFNKSFGKGIVSTTVEFSELWEGGGLVYIEAYFYDPVTDPKNPKGPKIQMQPFGKAPYGCFIKGKGISEVTNAEWKDKDGKLITGSVAFGSTVYLHIYTHALYGRLLDIKLQDKNKTMHLTNTGPDGSSSGRLDPAADDSHFIRRVSIYRYLNETSQPPAKSTIGHVVDTEGKKQENGQYKKIPNVQKTVFPVFIERKWQYTGNDYKKKFDIHPIVSLHDDPKKEPYDLTKVKLEIAEDGQLYPGDLKGNSPVTVDELELLDKKDPRERKDFIIGMFFDGTLNSSYNTEARQDFDKRHPGFQDLETKKKSQDVVELLEKKDKDKLGKYLYNDESSYENDLSNPAILYKNYETNVNTFSIYTEGIGTNTRLKPGEKFKENGSLPDVNYKKDDKFGYGLGQGDSGIIEKVHLGIQEAVKTILSKLDENTTIGTLTFDVFGFSRGAAAARHFVHEISLQSYPAKVINYYRTGDREAFDHNGYPIDKKYAPSDKLLPPCGHLGYLLTEANKTFDSLIIRFAGLYDTVPHHGVLQSNDIEDLGLNDIKQAKYTVHLVAADEHRANFSLVDIRCITGKEGGGETDRGIELYLPGVHCDVGGSYQDNKEEKKFRIDAFYDYSKIKDLKYELIRQGWFEESELYIYDEVCDEPINDGNHGQHPAKYRLNSFRKSVSNKYSFIPLHMMMDFCKSKGVEINETDINKKYKFSTDEFLNGIAKSLNTHKRYTFKEPPLFKQPDIVYDPSKSYQALTEYHRRQQQGQQKLNELTDLENKDIKTLRHGYLHWNSVWGAELIDVIVQAYRPNMVGNKRKRDIRG